MPLNKFGLTILVLYISLIRVCHSEEINYTQVKDKAPLENKTNTKENRWETYFKRKVYDPPAGFVVDGVKFIQSNPQGGQGKIAVDLGSGVGHETLFLLKFGYKVIAVDSEEVSFKYMMELPDIQKYSQNLTTIISTFENLNYLTLPPTDLVIASFSLPFVPERDFSKVWLNIVNTIKPGGYIIVNLFDSDFSFFDKRFRPNMTFHTKEKAMELFSQFNIIYFKEVTAEALKPGTQNHYYVFIAKKMHDSI
jgi:SAM-dependent methyltransferase